MAEIPQKSQRSDSPVQRDIKTKSQKKPVDFELISKVENYSQSKRKRKRSHSSQAHRRSRHHRAPGNSVFLRWIVLMLGLSGIALTCIIIWAFVIDRSPSTPRQTASTGQTNSNTTTTMLSAERAEDLVETGFTAKSPTELAKFLRHGNITPPEAFQTIQTWVDEHGDFTGFTWHLESQNSNPPSTIVIAHQSTKRKHFVPIIQTPDLSWKIDFDALTAHCSPAFDDFVNQSVSDGIVRVYGMPYNYFNRRYADDTLWACYSLTHPDSDQIIYGYCRRDSVAFKDLLEIQRDFALNNISRHNRMKLVLRLSKLNPSESRQYHIDEVITNTWMIPNEPNAPNP